MSYFNNYKYNTNYTFIMCLVKNVEVKEQEIKKSKNMLKIIFLSAHTDNLCFIEIP